jgi:DNA transposition AAA+ family ATPase
MKKNDNSMTNFYQHKDIKKYVTTYHNPNFKDTQISLVALIGCVAPSGTGKTQFILNYIAKSNCQVLTNARREFNKDDALRTG